MNQSPTIGALAAALAKAQGEIKGAVKDSTNPFFKSKYADLGSVKDACQDALTKHSIAVIQAPKATGALVTVTTMLAHESGEWISEELTAHAKDESAQSVGSVITYLRRYGLASMAGVTAEDDDGESAQPRQQFKPSPAQRLVDTVTRPVEDKAALLRASRIKVLLARHGEGFRGYCQLVLNREVASGKDLSDADLTKLEADESDVE
jgi:hypothetical protein